MGFDKVALIAMITILTASLLLIAYKPALLGVLAGALIVAVKAGLGCRYGSVGKKVVLAIALSYLLLSATLGFLLEAVAHSFLQLLNYTLIFHTIVAFLLIAAGYVTIKNSACGLDVSNKTYLAIVIPCPVCFAAIFLSCYFASEVVSGVAAGVLVGSVISSAILALSYEGKKSAERLGKIMLLLGVYYTFSMLLIPSFTEGLELARQTQISAEFDPYSLLLLLILGLGFVRGVLRWN